MLASMSATAPAAAAAVLAAVAAAAAVALRARKARVISFKCLLPVMLAALCSFISKPVVSRTERRAARLNESLQKERVLPASVSMVCRSLLTAFITGFECDLVDRDKKAAAVGLLVPSLAEKK
jgi:hypothetical protein